MDDVQRAVEIELPGPGKQFEYRAIHKKIRQLYELNVQRGLVYDVMYHLDPQMTGRTRSWWEKRRKVLLSLEDSTGYIPQMVKTSQATFLLN